MRKPLITLLAFLLAAALGVGIWFSAREGSVQTVKGLIGSEKEAFFRDPEVQQLLKKKYRLQVEYVKAGSREIANAEIATRDFAFPAGAPSAEALKKRAKAAQVYEVFYTPIVVASWQPVAELLAQNGLVKLGQPSTLDMRKMLPLMESGKRWKELKGSDKYPANRSVLLGSTDVRKSNSAAMYLALSSYVVNGEQVPQKADLPRLMPKISPLFLRQGYQENSSLGPFEDYLALGAGKAPAVVIYESQFLEKAREKALPAGAVLLYPTPTVFTKHMLVPLSDKGSKLGEALSNDPELQKLAARYGFRTRNPAIFQAEVAGSGVKLLEPIVDVANLPSQEVLNEMIEEIERLYSTLPAGQQPAGV